jgi:hypothetical protein
MRDRIMATAGSVERIRIAIAEAAENLARQPAQAVGRDTPAPGDLYVFDAGEDVGLEWLVVRSHPDDPGLLLLAPADDFPRIGTPDVALPLELVGRPLSVRCGETDWFPASFCAPRLRVGAVPEHALGLVCQRLADLARGRAIPTADAAIDLDPEYEEWIGEVARARVSLLARAEAARTEAPTILHLTSLLTTPPMQFAFTPALALAAETGGTLFAELDKALAEPGDVKYHEVPDVPGGRLFLVADAWGVRGVWEGPREVAPPIASASESGAEVPLSWRSGREGRLHQTERPVPWVDGRAVLVIGTAPSRTLAIDL